jgi:hypothetical protein
LTPVGIFLAPGASGEKLERESRVFLVFQTHSLAGRALETGILETFDEWTFDESGRCRSRARSSDMASVLKPRRMAPGSTPTAWQAKKNVPGPDLSEKNQRPASFLIQARSAGRTSRLTPAKSSIALKITSLHSNISGAVMRATINKKRQVWVFGIDVFRGFCVHDLSHTL